MGIFRSSRYYPVVPDDLEQVANEVLEHFRTEGYQVEGEPSLARGWYISITEDSLFKTVLGLKTALNIEIEQTSHGTNAEAGIGIFGRKVIPALLLRFIFWPLAVGQIIGMVRQARLDEKALELIGERLEAHGSSTSATAPPNEDVPEEEELFCPGCGTRQPADSSFCLACGDPL